MRFVRAVLPDVTFSAEMPRTSPSVPLQGQGWNADRPSSVAIEPEAAFAQIPYAFPPCVPRRSCAADVGALIASTASNEIAAVPRTRIECMWIFPQPAGGAALRRTFPRLLYAPAG